ncbi:MAG: polyisoprenoid-binding protein YceI [Arcticibacterium sp.]|jgi:polyisoprenoid-binding protein YceI
MKKNTLLGFALVAAISFQSCSSASEETTEEVAEVASAMADGTVALDLAASSVEYKGVMLGIKEHTGNVRLNEASLDMKGGAVSGGSFVVDLSNITPTDTMYDEKSTKEKLVGHLSSPDFFNVAEFPTASFVVTGSEGNTVTGNLTIRGITNEETVTDVVVSENGVSGTLAFDRTKYDVSFALPMKDMVISNDIVLSINLVPSM